MKTVAIICALVLIIGLQMADSERALDTCQAVHSADVCAYTLR